MVEGARLESVYRGNSIMGSNPILSAICNVKKKLIFKNNSETENKINIIFEYSTKFDESKYINKFDLIFIDGGHTYSVVKNDTEKSFKMLNKNSWWWTYR